MSVPKVSVLMAVYNTAPYLHEAIESVLSQSLRALELVVVDDCSTDDSWSVIEAAARRDRRIVALRREVNGGASAALNDGLRFARGEYLTRQDGDDVSLPERLAQQVAHLDSHPGLGGVATAVTRIDRRGQVLSTWLGPVGDAEIRMGLLTSMVFCGPTLMVRRSAFEQAGLRFEEDLSGSEDYDLCLRLTDVAPLSCLPQPLYLYRQHETMVSRSQEHLQLFRKAVALHRSLERRFAGGAPVALRRQVSEDYLRAALLGHRDREAAAGAWLQSALDLTPDLLRNVQWVEDTLRRCTPHGRPEAALRFVESVFLELLPRARALSRVRRRLVADLHMAEAFAAAGRDAARVRQHIWPAIRSNPGWLANRGALSLLVKDAVARRGRS